MRLYHFTTQQFGIIALQNRRLKIARIDRLNDPFEFLGWKLQDAETRTKLRRWKAERNKTLGILCFSHKWSNPLLWGHYADKHQGMALGFDVPDGDLYSPVRYRKERLPQPKDRELIPADVDDLLLTKFTAWRYESEYRCFCRLDESIQDGDHYFEPFSDTLKLAEVLVGDQATITRAELAAALGPQHADIVSFKARPAFGTFRVIRNRNAALWK
jgi:hypothetical protein